MTEAPLNHPSDETLCALSLGQLTEAELAPIATHLGDCLTCCRRIDQLTTADQLLARLQQCAASREHELVSPAQLSTAVRALRQSHEGKSAIRQRDPEAGTVSGIADVATVQAYRDAPPSTGLSDELTRLLAPPERPDEIGRLGPYRILSVLGQGGMGVVFRAHDPALERLVALKAMLPGVPAVPNARERFLGEARAAAALKHPHVVTIYQVGEDRGIPFLAMEFLEGESLDARIRRAGRLPLAEVLRIGRETALGLAAAHARGLVHRDIKPANLWLEASPVRQPGEYQVKILDFGLARATADQAHLTHSGFIVGTPAYMAPEQSEGKPVDPRCDLFSLGCVLYQMSTGTQPFHRESTIAVLRALALYEPPPVSEVCPESPQELSALVARLLTKNPEDRFQSAGEVADLLGRCRSEPSRHGRVEALGDSQPLLSKPTIALPEPVAGTRLKTEKRRSLGRRWFASAATILVLFTAFGLTEATGVTNVAGAIRHLFLPDGTSVVGNEPPETPAIKEAPSPPPLAKAPFDAPQAREHQKTWAKYLGVPVETTNKLGMKFRLIPPGEFTMGVTNAEAEGLTKLHHDYQDSKLAVPAHPVRLTRPFYLAEREVRYGDFLDLMKREPGHAPKHSINESDGVLMVNCTWFDCVEFCNGLSEREGLTPAYQVVGREVTVTPGATGYRLPTEAEWEFACRAGTTSLWYFGLTPKEVREMCDRNIQEAKGYLQPRVAAPNPFGLLGMYAGASEWCWDWHDQDYYQKCADGGVAVDPQGPRSGRERIVRGGSNFAGGGLDLARINSAARFLCDPVKPSSYIGFGRVALPIPAKGQTNSAVLGRNR